MKLASLKDGRDGKQGPRGKQGEEGAEGERGKAGPVGLSSGGGWTMQIFKGSSSFSAVPDLTTVKYVGSARVDSVSFPGLNQFRAYVPSTPHENFVWRFFGKVAIQKTGKYHFCTVSDDRSRVFVDDKFLLENLQVNVRNCKSRTLQGGRFHAVMVDGYNNGGPGGVVLTYQGPDTNNNPRSVPSADAASRPPPPPSIFHLRVWASASTLRAIPTNWADVVRVGDDVIPSLAFSGQGAGTLRSYVANTPGILAWTIWAAGVAGGVS